MISIHPVEGIGEVGAGDDIAALIARHAEVEDDDVVVVAHKIVSKSEGRILPMTSKRDAALAESAAVLRRRGDMVISVTRHGFVCANAGVDASNVPGDNVVLLPLDPDLSARRIRAGLLHLTQRDVAVLISDTFGRPWRNGLTNVAIGVAAMEPFTDHRGTTDMQGRTLEATTIAIADELAGAAEMVMGKSLGVCAAVVRGAPITRGRASATALVRPPGADLFR